MWKRLALVGLIAGSAVAARGDAIDSNPYVMLYANRVDIAKADVDRQKAVVAYEQSKYDRDQQLYSQNAASLEDVQQQKATLDVATLSVQDYVLREKEAENMLNITRVRIQAGQDMPICTYPFDSPPTTPSASGPSQAGG